MRAMVLKLAKVLVKILANAYQAHHQTALMATHAQTISAIHKQGAQTLMMIQTRAVMKTNARQMIIAKWARALETMQMETALETIAITAHSIQTQTKQTRMAMGWAMRVM